MEGAPPSSDGGGQGAGGGDIIYFDWNKKARGAIKEQQGQREAGEVTRLNILTPIVDRSVLLPFVGLKHFCFIPQNEIAKWQSFDYLPPLHDLIKLELPDHSLFEVPTDFAKRYPSIRILSMTANKFASIEDLAPLKECNKLAILNLDDNKLARNKDYRRELFELLPQVINIDGRDNAGNVTHGNEIDVVGEKSHVEPDAQADPVESSEAGMEEGEEEEVEETEEAEEEEGDRKRKRSDEVPALVDVD